MIAVSVSSALGKLLHQYEDINHIPQKQKYLALVNWLQKHQSKLVPTFPGIEDENMQTYFNLQLVGEISKGSKSYLLDSVCGIYNRAMEFSMVPEAQLLDKNSNTYKHYTQMFELFNQWIEIASCRVVNKASAMSSNGSKPYQQLLIQSFFAVPKQRSPTQRKQQQLFNYTIKKLFINRPAVCGRSCKK